jgi:hypothetical protein
MSSQSGYSCYSWVASLQDTQDCSLYPCVVESDSESSTPRSIISSRRDSLLQLIKLFNLPTVPLTDTITREVTPQITLSTFVSISQTLKLRYIHRLHKPPGRYDYYQYHCSHHQSSCPSHPRQRSTYSWVYSREARSRRAYQACL